MIILALTYLFIAAAVYGVAIAEDEKLPTAWVIAALWPLALIAKGANYIYTRWIKKQ